MLIREQLLVNKIDFFHRPPSIVVSCIEYNIQNDEVDNILASTLSVGMDRLKLPRQRLNGILICATTTYQ